MSTLINELMPRFQLFRNLETAALHLELTREQVGMALTLFSLLCFDLGCDVIFFFLVEVVHSVFSSKLSPPTCPFIVVSPTHIVELF